ncbi:SCO7613 C-terminal domain-containing membrane protein [Niallia endozanthoxylica]|uniref:DUF2157 domain-containing protein n=1 Tax=Niallia endozanthoxylica TaxID=2036016 RepID=A0A5J5HTT6_9BACI|nr:hypothetical protein [Niallia endozanthoxylica]KAA9023807.1 hypothetical protein F4V44_11730 [Niallia endozanthoxylica]
MMQRKVPYSRRQVFREELRYLKENSYIDEDDYQKIHLAYNQYVQELDEQQQIIESAALKKPKFEKPKPIKTKTALTAEQIRERNITWALILGVILLFIGGLVFGTSKWSSLNNLFKVLLVSMVSGVFFVSSYVADRYLHIQKTAFAFMTLGSLFLPISILSIGFFGLLGSWLSFYGGGKYLFGFIGSSICLMLYIYLAAQYKHRLFIWFSYLTATISVGFLLSMTYLPRDFFYLGIMLYNALLLFGYYKWKTNKRLELFTKELPLYAQLNLIVSTLLMLFFYENAILYSFNILLTAALYISMVYVNKTKHYHYIFTLLFVYGMYQLIENTYLESIRYIGFAFIGILYLLVQKYADKENHFKRMFQITSAIISFCAFLFISIQGLLLRSDEDSLVLFAAYIIIAINYVYLSNIAKPRIFRFLAPFFLLTAGLQSYYILFKHVNGNYVDLYLFAFATIMFLVFYLKNSFTYLIPIRTSSFIISVATMILMILVAVGNRELMHASILFFAFGLVALLAYKFPLNEKWQKVSTWVYSVAWVCSWICLFDWLDRHVPVYRYEVEIMGHLALGGLLLLAVSYVWKSKNQHALDLNTFIIAAALYTLGMLSTLLEGSEHPILTSSIYAIGIAFYILLVYKVKIIGLWTLVSVTTIAFFASLAQVFQLENNNTLAVMHFLLIPVLLLAVYEFIGRKVNDLRPYFFWSAHAFLVPVFLVSLFYIFFAKLQPAILLIGMVPYLYSALTRVKEWEIKLFLYAGFSTLPLFISVTIRFYHWDQLFRGEHLFILVSGIISIVWLLGNDTWKKRIDWYLVPQSCLGLLIFIPFVNELEPFNLVLVVIYTVFILFLLHRRSWKMYTIIPLLLSTVYLTVTLSFCEKWMKIGLVLVAFLALHLFGRYAFARLVSIKPLQIDWYTVISSIYVWMLFVIIHSDDPLWLKLLPSLLIVYFFYSLINRFTSIVEKMIVKTITAISVLLPYYITLAEFETNQYIETELYTLPFIVLTIFLSTHTWKDYKKMMRVIQLVVLLIVTITLVIDALYSNTIYDAIIIGVLSLGAILSGMHFRIKAYFFVGISVLLLNVLLQTKPYWGNFPWWGYLIIAGLTLIGFASSYELQKQKKDSNKRSFFQKKKEQILQKFKDWD